MPDHIHLVVRFKAEPSVATMVKIIKSKSSKWLNDQPKRPGRFEWQRGYAAFTVSVSQLESVQTYVRNQEQHHRRKTFQDELRLLLEKHGVVYDERYLWT
jgi:REP element-mobilizing transposase RayT